MEHRAGRHVDEGTLHAWFDGALSADDAAAVEAHVAECESCAAAAAEARGLVAAASRILTALDDVPAGVLPLGGEGAGAGAERRRGEYGRRRRPLIGWPLRAAAAILVVATGSLVVLQRSGGPARVAPTGAAEARAPVAFSMRPAVPEPSPSSTAVRPPARLETPAAKPAATGVALDAATSPSGVATPPASGATVPAGGALAAAGVAKETDIAAPVPAAPAPATAQAYTANSVDMARKSAPRAEGFSDSTSEARRDSTAAAAPQQQRAALRLARSGARVTVLRGRVVSSANGQPVPSATVSLLDPVRAVQTGTAGEYAIAVPDTLARATVRVRALGYAPATRTLTLPSDSASRDIALTVDRYTLSAAEVTVAGGCFLAKSAFFPSSFTLDTVPIDTAHGDTLLLRLGAADARRFPVAYWTHHGPDSVTLFIAADSESPGIRIDAALGPAGLDGHTVPPDDAVSQSSPFTATRCRPTR